MPRGNASQSKVHYQGKEDDFVILVEDVEAVKKWKGDRSIPLAQVVSGFKIFITHKWGSHPSHPESSFPCITLQFCCWSNLKRSSVLTGLLPHRHGAQGVLDTASKSTLENEFGTSNEDEVLKKILESGDVQATETNERQGPKNISQGGSVAH